MKIETSKASGLALDWALAVAMGCTSIRQQHTQALDGPVKIDARDPDGFFIRVDHTDPAVWGGLIKEHKINVTHEFYHKDCAQWVARIFGVKDCGCFIGKADTPEQAVARCVVAMHCGDKVNVPDELLEVLSYD